MHGSVALVQGLYFLMTGLWPLVSIGTFQQVTGPKIDLWLVNTVGVLVAVIGAALILAGLRGEVTPSVLLVAVGSAAGLAGVYVIYVSKGVISRIYRPDALVEVVLMIWWLIALAALYVARTRHLTRLDNGRAAQWRTRPIASGRSNSVCSAVEYDRW